MAWLKIRKGTYYAKFRLGEKELVKTTKVKVDGGGIETPVQAERRAQRIADDIEAACKEKESQAVAAKESPSIRAFLESVSIGGREQHRNNVKRAIGLFIEYLGDDADKPLDTINRTLCESFIKHELGRVAAGTVSSYKQHLSTAFNRAYHDELINRNPWALVTVSKLADEVNPELRGGGDKQEREPFTVEEMKYLLYKLPTPWRDLVAVSFFTGGQRIGDCIALTWNQIDFEENTINMQTQKTSKKMLIPLLPVLKSRLEAIKASDLDSVLVFPEFYHMRRRAAGSVSTAFTALIAAAGIDTLKGMSTKKGERRSISRKSFHSIRHTVVSMLRINPAVTVDIARAIVGHDSEVVEQGYFTAPMAVKQQALAGLASALAPCKEEE